MYVVFLFATIAINVIQMRAHSHKSVRVPEQSQTNQCEYFVEQRKKLECTQYRVHTMGFTKEQTFNHHQFPM